MVLFETATLRSGYQLADTKAYGDRIERMLRLSMNVAVDEQVAQTGQVSTGRVRCEEQLVSKLVFMIQVEEEPEEEPAEEDSEDKEDDSEEKEEAVDEEDEEEMVKH